MKTAYILIGVPASGKSTWVKNFKADRLTMVISTDTHIENYAIACNKTYSDVFAEYIKTATSKMMDDLNKTKANGYDIIWDQTNTTVKARARKLRLLAGYKKVAVVLETPVENELQRRLDSRVGKRIPTHVVNLMIQNFESPSFPEGFEEIIYVKN